MGAAISWTNNYEGAIVATSVAGATTSHYFDTAFPGSNLADPDPSRVARSHFVRNGSAGSADMTAAFGSTNLPVRVAAALNCRIPPSATSVTLSVVNAAFVLQGSVTYSAAELAMPKPGTLDRFDFFFVSSTLLSANYLTLAATCPAGTTDYMEGGTFWGGDALILDGVNEQWRATPSDPSIVDRKDGGALLADVRSCRPGFTCGIEKLTFAQAFGATAAPTAQTMRALQLKAGKHAPVILLPRTDSNFNMMALGVYGSLRSVPFIRHVGGDKYDSEIDIDGIT